MKIGLGRLGLLPEQMMDLTFREFFYMYEGFMDHQQWLQREEYERMRLQTTALLQVHVKKGKQLKPKDVFKFEWDKSEIERVPFDEEQARVRMRKAGITGRLLHSGGI